MKIYRVANLVYCADSVFGFCKHSLMMTQDEDISYQSDNHDNSKDQGDQQTCQNIQLFIPSSGFVFRKTLHDDDGGGGG